MTTFSDQPPRRIAQVTMRLTKEQDDLLNQLAKRIGSSRVEVLRRALDYWVQNAPEARLKRK